jgi:hypothetical protein
VATFSPAQFQAVIDQITSGLTTFEGNLAKIPPAAHAATSHWWIDPVARETLTWIADKTVEIGTAILNWIKDLLKGAVAPIYLFMDGLDWLDVKGDAAGVATDIGAQKIVVGASGWSGDAADAYTAAAGRQADAANRLASIASTTSTTTLSVAGAGLLFYLALAAVLAKLIAASVTAIAAFGSAVFSWAGAALLLEEAGVDSTAIWAAVGALTAFLSGQVAAMAALHSETVDPSHFPGGTWPDPTTTTYADGSVKDGRAHWSLKQ